MWGTAEGGSSMDVNSLTVEPNGITLCVRKKPRAGWHGAKGILVDYSSKPLGFLLCQFQESRHISCRPRSAFQPRTSADLAGSA